MKTLIQQPGRSKLVSFAFMKSPEWRQHDFVCLRWENDVWIDCEATARLMKSIAFWVHLGFPGSATYTKSSTEELDSTTFWLRELVQHSNSSHPSAVAGAGCKKIHELQARNAAVVPAVVFRSSFAAHFTSTRCRAQSTRYKATRKPKVGRNSQSISVQFRLSRENDNATNLYIVLPYYEYYSMRSRDSRTQNRQEAVPCSTANFPGNTARRVIAHVLF
jgi:hypothetical protein